jgi:hypothetical protein
MKNGKASTTFLLRQSLLSLLLTLNLIVWTRLSTLQINGLNIVVTQLLKAVRRSEILINRCIRSGSPVIGLASPRSQSMKLIDNVLIGDQRNANALCTRPSLRTESAECGTSPFKRDLIIMNLQLPPASTRPFVRCIKVKNFEKRLQHIKKLEWK